MNPKSVQKVLDFSTICSKVENGTLASLKKFLRYFPKDYSRKLKEYAKGIMSSHAVLVLYDKEDHQKAFCSHCEHDVVLPTGHKMGKSLPCPHCGNVGIVKYGYMNNGEFWDYCYFQYWDKADYDKKSVVCRGIFVKRTVYTSPRRVEYIWGTRCYYLFTPQKAEMYKFHDDWWEKFTRFIHCKSCYPYFSRYINSSLSNVVTGECKESLLNAIKGTPFQYCQAEIAIDDISLGLAPENFSIRFMELAAKYPTKVEFLMKAGFKRLVYLKCANERIGNIFSWNAKTLDKFLKMPLTKQERKFIAEIKPSFITPALIRLFQLIKRMGIRKPLPELLKKYGIMNVADVAEEIGEILKYVPSVEKICNYIEKQKKTYNSPRWRYGWRYVAIEWKDYLFQTNELNLPLDDISLFPKKLAEAHDLRSKQYSMFKDSIKQKLMEEKMAKLSEMRRKFEFHHDGLFCRAAKSIEELKIEGTQLNHCVYSYAERYAEGSTHIIFIRREKEPDVPYVTMEVSQYMNIVQVRAYKNHAPSEEVMAFVDLFKQVVLKKQVAA